MHGRKKNALDILDKKDCNDLKMQQLLSEERASAEIARMILETRLSLGLTQKELARRVRTTQSVIARLEDADNRGQSLSMLHRIAVALGKRLEVRFLPNGQRRKAA